MKTRKLTELALLTAVALILFVVELQIPNPIPIPGVKLGLAEAIRCGVTTVADYMQLQPVKGLGKLELDIAKDMGVRMGYGRGYRDHSG